MASSDIKHDYNMEAGLLSTQGEERMLTKEAQFQDSELANSRDDTRTTSCARRALIALAVVCLVGVGLVSLGGGVCPGHLRHTVNGEISVKDAIHSHKPNLSDSMAQLARRQDNLTPGASSNTGSGDSSTDSATEPTAGPTDASTTDQPSDTAQATSTQPEASQTSDTNQPSSTAAQESTTQEASTSSEDTPSSTEQSSSDAATTSNAPSSTAAETTAESQSSSQAESTTDSADQASSTTSDSTKERTITTGTRTTSSAVKKTFTATMENGGITTLTSTSWVAVVPNSQSTSASDASLQNAASQSSISGVLSAVISMMFGGLLLL